MPFDVEAARKAGYGDAEIASYLAGQQNYDLAGAKKAGYTDGDVLAHLAAAPARAQIPVGQRADGTIVYPTPKPPAPEPSLADKAIGTGEAALTTVTGAAGGTLGMAGGLLRGLSEAILSGKFGTPEAADLVERAVTEGGRALTYEPRTPSGQEQAGAVGKFVGDVVVPAVAAVPGVGEMAAPLSAAGKVIGSAAAARVAGLAQDATTLPRRALEALRSEPEPTPGTQGSVGAAGTDIAAQRRALGSDLPVPIPALTKGQATRDAAQLKFETETAKIPDAGAPLRQRTLEQNQALLQNFDHLIDQTGAQAPNLRATGQVVTDALVAQAARDKAQVRTAYKAAEKAGAMEDPVTLSGVVDHLNDAAPDAATAPLLDVARRRALQLGIATEGDDGALVPQPVTLRIAETFRQAVGGATDFTPTNVRQATILKGLVDEATAGLGGDGYAAARALRARYAQNYEDIGVVSRLLNNKRGTADRQVAIEDVFKHSVLDGSLDDVRQVRRVLQRSGDAGTQGWRELQGATATWIRDQATQGVATDSLGNRVISPAGLDKAVRSLDADGKLDFVFGKKGAQQMRDIRELAQIARTVPPEAAVNTSNTASALLAGFVDVGSSSLSGMPLPLATSYRVVRQYVKDRALQRRIEDALGQLPRRAPSSNRNPPAVQEPSPAPTVH